MRREWAFEVLFHYILMMQQLFNLTVADVFMHAKQADILHLNTQP